MSAMCTAGVVGADPAADAIAKLDELSRQAVQTREAMTRAQRDADDRSAAQTAAEERHRADLATLDAANAQLSVRQDAADKVAAAMYVSGRSGQAAAVLTARSPQQVIDQLSFEQVVTAEAAEQLKAFQEARGRAVAASRASEKSAAEARTAAERSAAVRAELQAKLSELLRKIAAAQDQYAALTPEQQAVVDNAATPPPPPADPMLNALPGEPPAAAVAPGAGMEISEALPVGVARETGLQPNTVLAARAVSQRFPQIAEIGGVRPDSKPWHPSGLAIDIMIPNPESAEGIALGDEILAFAMANAGQLGLQDVIWRGTYYTPAGPQASGYGHYDHVHITTTRRR